LARQFDCDGRSGVATSSTVDFLAIRSLGWTSSGLRSVNVYDRVIVRFRCKQPLQPEQYSHTTADDRRYLDSERGFHATLVIHPVQTIRGIQSGEASRTKLRSL